MEAVLYNYPLDTSRLEIWLLRIHPPRGGRIWKSICRTLQTCSLDGKSNYVALSYVWGDRTVISSTPIIIDGIAIPVSGF